MAKVKVTEETAEGLEQLAAEWDLDSPEEALDYLVEGAVKAFEKPASRRRTAPASPASQ